MAHQPAQALDEPATGALRSQERLLEGLRRDFGAVCMDALANPKVVELMLNPDGAVWLDEHGQGMHDTGFRMRPSQAMKLFTTIASLLGTTITAKEPILEGELPLDGSRFEGLISPLVSGPTFAIRKKALQVFTLEDYASRGILTHRDDDLNQRRRREASFAEQVSGMPHAEVLREAVKLRKNILVVGSTGSGKTTLVNALIDAVATITPHHRVVLIEDTGEIQCSARNYVQMRSASHIDMTRLLKATMRLRPDRIIVGEVRGAEALALLKAWNTGHPGGLATVHANDAEAGLVRLQQLIQEGISVVNPHFIAEAVDLVVFIDKEEGVAAGRKVREVMLVEEFDEATKRYRLVPL